MEEETMHGCAIPTTPIPSHLPDSVAKLQPMPCDPPQAVIDQAPGDDQGLTVAAAGKAGARRPEDGTP